MGGTNIIFNLGGWGKTIYWFCVWNIHLGVFCNDTISVFMFILEFTMISSIALIIFGWNFTFYLSENNKLFKLIYDGNVWMCDVCVCVFVTMLIVCVGICSFCMFIFICVFLTVFILCVFIKCEMNPHMIWLYQNLSFLWHYNRLTNTWSDCCI